MGWLFGCFKCRQRRSTSNSINVAASCKDGRRVSSTVGPLTVDSAQAKESIEVERIISVQGDELKRSSSACIKQDRKSGSARRPSSEQLMQVEKLEEEIDSLNRKLVEEATQATQLTDEVRHLRNCSALLDSPNAFRKALSALEQALEKGYVEESQPLLYLQSLLAKIEPPEEAIETSSEGRYEERQAKSSFECIDVSLATKKDQNSSEKVHDKVIQVEHDLYQGNILNSVTIPREPDEGQRVMPKYEQNICNSRRHYSSDVVDTDAKKTQLISVVKRRRSSTTLSFSGFLVAEDVTEEKSISVKATMENNSSTEFLVTKIIEKTDLSGENLVEASKSLFAFSTDSSQSNSTLAAQVPFGNNLKGFSFLDSDLEADSCSEKSKGNGSFCNLQYRSPSYLWSPQDDKTCELDRVCSSLSTEQCQIDAKETSYNGFSDADTSSLSSTFCSNSMDHISSSPLDSEENVSSHATVQALDMLQPEESVTRSMDKSVYLCQQNVASIDPVKGYILHEAGSEVKHDSKSSISEGQMRVEYLQNTDLGKGVFFKNPMNSSFSEAPLKVLDKSASSEEVSRSRVSHTSQCSSHGDFSILGSEAIVELPSPGTTSIWSPDTQTSSHNVHNSSPLRPVAGIEEGCPSDFLSETPSTPVSVNSHESRLHLAKAGASQPNFTPTRTPLASSLTQAETPSTIPSPGSSSSLGKDRPILGTVAAHWNHSSTSSMQKWWDGKGIPNSTNKYKEDQKVSWHATPFEVRLERALAKQGRVFQKKLFTGAMATEMEVRL